MRRHDRGDTTYYYHQDGAGNVVALLKKTGTTNAITAQYDSLDPFGNGQTNSGSVPNPLQFAGREYDAETGLNYLRARYYDPAVGRFVSEDPAGAGINQYAYAGNDPGDGRDPSGLAGCKSECSDPDGAVHRLWLLCHELPCGDWPVDWRALLNFELFGPIGRGGNYGAVDTWFLMNGYPFGLAGALNGTSGDCTFSGGGSIYCSAGGFSYGASTAAWPAYAVKLAPNEPFEGCPNANGATFKNIPLDQIWVPDKGVTGGGGHANFRLNSLTEGGAATRVYYGRIQVWPNQPGVTSFGGDVKFLGITCSDGSGRGSGALDSWPL